MGFESDHAASTAQPSAPAAVPALPAALAGSPQSVVLALQRGHGNAAVARYLGRAGATLARPPAAAPAAPVAHSARFTGKKFERIAQGRTTLKLGAKGLEVTQLQQALVDAGVKLNQSVSGTFDDHTHHA